MTRSSTTFSVRRAAGLLALTMTLAAGGAFAQTVLADPSPPESGLKDHIYVPSATVDVTPPPGTQQAVHVEQPRAASLDGPCCNVPAGAVVAIQLVEPLGTHRVKTGDAFPLRLAAPLIVDGHVALPAGAMGMGRVVQATRPGLGGKGAKLVVSADYLVAADGRRVPLQGLKLAGAGEDRSTAANVAGIGGIAFAPLGILGFAIEGGDIELPAGTAALAKVARPAQVAAVASATPADYDKVRALLADPDPTRGWITVGPPPRGMGQVVFFRPQTPLGTGQWFNVRENGNALGKLTNGAYFIAALPPGQHSFTASTEPEFKDKLMLKVDAGETYYVEGDLTKGVIIGAAALNPSDKAKFDYVSSELQPTADQTVVYQAAVR